MDDYEAKNGGVEGSLAPHRGAKGCSELKTWSKHGGLELVWLFGCFFFTQYTWYNWYTYKSHNIWSFKVVSFCWMYITVVGFVWFPLSDSYSDWRVWWHVCWCLPSFNATCTSTLPDMFKTRQAAIPYYPIIMQSKNTSWFIECLDWTSHCWSIVNPLFFVL